MKAKACQLFANNVDKAKQLHKFNEDDPIQHMLKVMFGCGLYAGFRGSTEHAYFTTEMVSQGHYPQNFEDKTLAGKPFVAISNFQDKSNKLSVHNSYLRDTANILRFKVNFECPNDFGASLVRLMDKHSPGQKRMYCFLASEAKKATFCRSGFPNACFFPDRPIGYKTLLNYIKTVAVVILGLPVSFCPHSLRSACITMLANDPAVSNKETMRVARHSAQSTTTAYMRADGISEGNRLRAFGLVTTPSSPVAKKQKVEEELPMEFKKEEEVPTPPCNVEQEYVVVKKAE